jgi:hypothetical protein
MTSASSVSLIPDAQARLCYRRPQVPGGALVKGAGLPGEESRNRDRNRSGNGTREKESIVVVRRTTGETTKTELKVFCVNPSLWSWWLLCSHGQHLFWAFAEGHG